ncbi:MAG: hypothetical protein ACO3P9_11265, partial [Phycisphaerales bacterium]
HRHDTDARESFLELGLALGLLDEREAAGERGLAVLDFELGRLEAQAGGPSVRETARGGRLIWGRPDAGAAEVPVATRIAWLDALQAGNGSIDPPPARQFDLRLDYLATAPRRIAVR